MKPERNEEGETLEEFLAHYDVNKYPRPSVTADIAVFTLVKRMTGLELAVLLVKRRNHPSIGKYALPGGFINMDETLEQAAARELKEETGVEGLPLVQFGAFGAVDRDPRTRVITVAHYAVAPMDSLKIEAGDDAAAAELFTVDMCREAACASAEQYRITLLGERMLTARGRLCYDALGAHTAQAVIPGDLASDHDHVLFAALYALYRQPLRRVARLLTLGRPELEGAACKALKNALGCLHAY